VNEAKINPYDLAEFIASRNSCAERISFNQSSKEFSDDKKSFVKWKKRRIDRKSKKSRAARNKKNNENKPMKGCSYKKSSTSRKIKLRLNSNGKITHKMSN